MSGASPWWRPETFGGRVGVLRARMRMQAALRSHFAAAAFDEVDTPILQVSPGNEAHLSAFATALVGDDGGRRPLFLQTSPEFACKKLLAAGVPRLFTFAHAFRNRERGRLHHPEFTMLEWYRAGEPLERLIADVADVLRVAAGAAGVTALRYRGRTADPGADPEAITVVDAFRRHAGIDLGAMLPDSPGARERLAAAVQDLGLRVAPDDGWSDLFSKILSAKVEPQLGFGAATILHRYPASEAALARLCPDDRRFAERFEVYVCGIELANAFAELTDAAEQRRRFVEAEAERQRIYGETYPIDPDFLAAVTAMPDASGIALGFDRLAMLALGLDHIEDVLWAPVAADGA